MKKIITKTIPARTYTTKATTKKIEVVYCDICQLNNKSTIAVDKCYICDRDICYKHTAYNHNSSDDYPDHLCPICYKLKFGSEFNARRYAIERKYEIDLETLDEDIKKASLESEQI